jgi:hypothetical protein
MLNARMRKSLMIVAALFLSGAPLSSRAQSRTFLPEVERVLDTDGVLGARAYVDFETGLVTVERLPDDPERDRRLHRDLKLELTPGAEEWTGIGLEVTPATEEFWNAPADRVVAALADNLAPPLATMQVTPGLWFFKTAGGDYGLMRVVGFVEPRPGDRAMKIIYKLAEPVPSGGVQTNSAK